MSLPAIPDNQLVFYNHPEHSWVLGYVQKQPDSKGIYSIKDKDNGGASYNMKRECLYPVNNHAVLDENVSDLLLLSELHQSTLLNTVRRRYFDDVVYTYIGPIVIAINPFNYNIPWYHDDFMPNYLLEGPVIQKNKPHSWAVAHNTYFELINDNHPQSILVSGESGAGKTEAVKIVLKYLRGLMHQRAKDDSHRGMLMGTCQKVLLASPILEAFGNAKTGRNDNSSRFGKFLRLQFDAQGYLMGSSAIPYLLEKSRVITAAQGERIYHSFYQVAKGKDAASYGLSDPKALPTLMSGGILDNASMEDAAGDDLSYRMTNEAFKCCGVSDAQGKSVWKILAALLQLGCVEYEAKGDASALTGKSRAFLDNAATLLSVPVADLHRELMQTTTEVRGEAYTIQHTPAQCRTIRNSLVQSCYNGIFLWLFDTINADTAASEEGPNWIGLLDIFGFEDFKVNSFEQLCINLANETLQNHYNSHIFTKDMEECKAEGVDVTSVTFSDNKPTCDMLIEKMGIFALLDEECSLGKGSDLGFLDKITEHHGKHPSFVRQTLWKTAFAVTHYAGTVKYEVENFLIKNKDILKDQLKTLIRGSVDSVVKEILPAPVDKKGRAITVSGYFVQQIVALMDTINSTNPHWIRCVKPHPAKKPRMLHGSSTMSQLVNSGVIETVRIRTLGFPVRIPLGNFASRFVCIAKASGASIVVSDTLPCCRKILESCAYTTAQAQIGKSKVFIKSHVYQDIEDRKRQALARHATIVQCYARRCVSLNLLREKIMANNKELIEKLEAVARKLRSVRDQESELRDKLEAAEVAAREVLATQYRKNDPAWVFKLQDCQKEADTVMKQARSEWKAGFDVIMKTAVADKDRIKEQARLRAEEIARAKREEMERKKREEELERKRKRDELIARRKAEEQIRQERKAEIERKKVAQQEADLAARMEKRARQSQRLSEAARKSAQLRDKEHEKAVSIFKAREERCIEAAVRRKENETCRAKAALTYHRRDADVARRVEAARRAEQRHFDAKVTDLQIEAFNDQLKSVRNFQIGKQLQTEQAERLRVSGISAHDPTPPNKAEVSRLKRLEKSIRQQEREAEAQMQKLEVSRQAAQKRLYCKHQEGLAAAQALEKQRRIAQNKESHSAHKRHAEAVRLSLADSSVLSPRNVTGLMQAAATLPKDFVMVGGKSTFAAPVVISPKQSSSAT